jgi:prepilin peptidase CpaA
MLEPSMLSVLVILLALASVWDLALHRIPNSLVVGVAATGLLAQAMHGATSLVSSAFAIVVAGAVTWPAWSRCWIGGGDLKLAAATAAWLGIARVPIYVLASAVAIGVLSLAAYALSARSAREEMRQNLALAARGVPVAAPVRPEAGRAQVPAGAGFAIGAITTLAFGGGL